MHNLTVHERAAVETFRRALFKEWGSRIKDFRIFGSRARGEGHEASDIDLLVLVDEISGKIRHDIYGAAADYLLSYDVVLSPLVMAQAQYDSMKSRERLLIQEIERDGIAL